MSPSTAGKHPEKKRGGITMSLTLYIVSNMIRLITIPTSSHNLYNVPLEPMQHTGPALVISNDD
jgi:hypothetical protein